MTARHPHGTWRRYRHDGCKCDPCLRAWAAYGARSKLNVARGTSRLVDATPAVEHVLALGEEWGVAAHRVWVAGGSTRQYGHNLMKGNNRKADRDVVAAVCAVTIDDLPDEAWMFADRALELLAEIRETRGWTYAEVDRRAGFKDGYSINLRRHRVTRARIGVWRALRQLAEDPDLQAVVCVDCGAPPWSGGLRCRDCYTAHANPQPFRSTGCGTDAGYTRHLRAGEPACEACKQAHRHAQAMREAVA